RNVRSMLNIMYHATENAGKRNIATIDEQAIDDTIKSVYPGLRIRGSVMDVPISEFIKIRRNCNDMSMLESGVRNAVKDLVNYDPCKMIDLIYFSDKYKNNNMQQDDSQRAILLAKSIRLC